MSSASIQLGFILVRRESSSRVHFVVRDEGRPDPVDASLNPSDGLMIWGSLLALQEWWREDDHGERFPIGEGWEWRKLSAL